MIACMGHGAKHGYGRIGLRLLVIVVLAGALGTLVGCSCSKQSANSSDAANSSLQVPNVVGLSQVDAEKSITGAGFSVGTITTANSDTIAPGSVISQTPAALAMAQGGTVINLVISSGPAVAKQVTVPSLSGMTQTQAEAALQAAGLVPVAGDPVVNGDVAPGIVFQQTPTAGATAVAGSSVTFTVALGETLVTVPDVTGKSRDDASTGLANAGLGVDTTEAYSDTVSAGLIISTNPAAGTSVKSGTKVTMCISLGVRPASQVTVPNLMTLTLEEAQASLNSAGLSCNACGDLTRTVVSQDPINGTLVDQGTTVTIVLAGALDQVSVPNLAGMTLSDAQQALQSNNLYCAYSGDTAGGVVSQEPVADTLVNENSTVNIVLNRITS